MGKNIAVIDADGNVYGATWPKRARGPVKSGRARFVNRNTICLVRPPAYVEGKCMEHTVDLEIKNTQQPETVEKKLDTTYIVHKIDEILEGNAELRAAIAQMENLKDTPAEALSHMMEAREATNQRLIGLLQNILETVKPDPSLVRLEAVTKLLSDAGLEENHKFDLLNQTIQRLF